MKQVILHVLCEGDTEDRFVSLVLSPYFRQFGMVVKHQMLLTNKKKGITGGVISYEQVKRDLVLMTRQFADNGYEEHWFTTMFDLYALPGEFPGMDKTIADPYLRVAGIEQAFTVDFNHPRLIPYIQLHEFEALVFTNLDYLLTEYPNAGKAVEALKVALGEKQGNPELVDDGYDTAPSKRIISALDKYHHDYNKVKVGPDCALQKGVEALMAECRHFGEWVKTLKAINGI